MACTLQQVVGTGPDGRIRAQDVESFVPSAAGAAPPFAPAPGLSALPPPPPPAPGVTFTDVPLTNIRQVSWPLYLLPRMLRECVL